MSDPGAVYLCCVREEICVKCWPYTLNSEVFDVNWTAFRQTGSSSSQAWICDGAGEPVAHTWQMVSLRLIGFLLFNSSVFLKPEAVVKNDTPTPPTDRDEEEMSGQGTVSVMAALSISSCASDLSCRRNTTYMLLLISLNAAFLLAVTQTSWGAMSLDVNDSSQACWGNNHFTFSQMKWKEIIDFGKNTINVVLRSTKFTCPYLCLFHQSQIHMFINVKLMSFHCKICFLIWNIWSSQHTVYKSSSQVWKAETKLLVNLSFA